MIAAVRGKLELETLDWLWWFGIALAVVTGLIHLGLGLGAPRTPVGAASVLAGLGYAGAIALILLGYRRRLVAALGIPFVGSQIVLWYVINRPATIAEVSLAAMIDKPVQIVLIAVLLVLVLRDG